MLVKKFVIGKHQVRFLFRAAIVLCWPITFVILQGCTNSEKRLDLEAGKFGFSREIVYGNGFNHMIYIHDGDQNRSTLHVYLEGDGRPWIGNRLISSDPTPANPMLLKLMAMDRAPSIYLGRPCYHGFSSIPPCEPALWTSARYSTRVVRSMQRVLLDYMALGGYSEVVLIGHSGGGTLAMLLAERISGIRAVVTIAGNLDIDAWTEHHGYSPLTGSLNPAHMLRMDPEIQQYHLTGKADNKVPHNLIEQFLWSQPDARVLVWEGFDHACCWHKIWREFLRCLDNDCRFIAD